MEMKQHTNEKYCCWKALRNVKRVTYLQNFNKAVADEWL